MSIDAQFYEIFISIIKIVTLLAVVFILKLIKNSNECDESFFYYKIYFILIIVGTLADSISSLIGILAPFNFLMSVYIFATFCMFMILNDKLKTTFMMTFSIVSSFLFLLLTQWFEADASFVLGAHIVFAMSGYSYLAYLAYAKSKEFNNFGYLVMAVAFILLVASVFGEIYFFMQNNFIDVFALAHLSTTGVIILVAISFLTINLINEQKYFSSLALTDTLTGMLNRRGLEYKLQSIIPTYNRNHKCFSVITVDIDFFKKINDTYGHDVGDLVLKEFAKLVGRSHRNVDISCRFGGEEFIIVLPETNEEQAKLIAENIRQKVEQHKIDIGEKMIDITASFGVATCCDEIDIESLFKSSDKALYTAKFNGRNQVVHIDDPIKNSA